MKWRVVYKRDRNPDGSLFFPERLTEEFLENIRRVQGSYFYANQYQNRIIPDDQKCFKKEWIRYAEAPDGCMTFVFIDPAISQAAGADYTAVIVVKTDIHHNWYVEVANRYKINPTEIVNLIFRINDQYKPQSIGIEDVAFQKALLYMINEEMGRRNNYIPVTGVKPSTDKTKEMRILGLVPKFEWSKIYLKATQTDLLVELAQFPRGSHDDLIDALAYITEIVHYPSQGRKQDNEPAPNSPNYESWYIKNLVKRSNSQDDDY